MKFILSLLLALFAATPALANKKPVQTCKVNFAVDTASKNGDIGRTCGKEGSPFCTEHQFIAEVLQETEAVTCEICEQRETALTQWREEIRRLRFVVAHAEALPPAAFVKSVHEVLPELHRAAMEAAIYTYISSRSKEE